MPYKDKSAAKARAAARYQSNREKALADAAAYRAANPEKIKAWSDARTSEYRAQLRAKATIRRGGVERIARCDAHVREWARANTTNAGKANPRAASMRGLHDHHVKAFRALSNAERYRWRYRNDREFTLNERLRRQLRKKSEAVPGLAELVRYGLRSGGASNKVESLLGYSMSQLRSHLERQFTRGMSWNAFGKAGIHIDHILPRKCFDLSTVEGVQAYWSLSNLRPLKAKENLRKGANVTFLI